MTTSTKVARVSPKMDAYQQVTHAIITQLEKGTVPWRKTWGNYGLARNYVTNRVYQGINFVLLNMLDYSHPMYLTYNQAKKLGGSIAKGSKSHLVVFYTKVFRLADGNYLSEAEAKQLDENQYHSFLVPKYYRVFNIKFLEGVEVQYPVSLINEGSLLSTCQAIVTEMKDPPEREITFTAKPAYFPSEDRVTMPDIQLFSSSEEYYNTFFHELVHSTGHEKRLSRKTIVGHQPFGSAAYSEEELIAELGASFLCAFTGINRQEIMQNNAAYINGWLSKLAQDKKVVFSAASQARKAVRWMTSDLVIQ